jgi:hypothetical protein
MAQKFKSIIVPEASHIQGTEIAVQWKEVALGTLTHGDIYRMGLQMARAKLAAENPTSQKVG